ncbi:DUF4145 domain-containing protein [Streptomyces sp. NPDC050848]|uniref:DUF4145 domain-containing protein n=1 Tax=Streptomyces sp. NPDC050848 TaxID=3155791 RepID=UPI0033C2E489
MPYFEFADKRLVMGVYQCSNERCRKYSIGSLTAPNGRNLSSLLAEEPQHWEPTTVRRPDFPDVPDEIAETAAEAHACLSIGAPRGAVALARAVVESSAKAKGITVRGIAAKIDEMSSRGLIRELTKTTAHAIRLAGNEVAHGDIGQVPIPQDEAEVVVRFMDSFLEEVFQHPAKLQQLQDSMAERRQQ